MGQQYSRTVVDDVKYAISGTLVKQAANCAMNSTVNNKLTFDGDIIAAGGGRVNINQKSSNSFDFTCTQDQKVQQQLQAEMRADLTASIKQKIDGAGVGVSRSDQTLRATSALIDQLNISDIAKCVTNLQTNNTQEFKGRVIAINQGVVDIEQSVSDVVHQNCVQNQLANNTNYRTLVDTFNTSTEQTNTGVLTANSLSSTATSSSMIWMIGGVIVVLSLFGGKMPGGKGGGGGGGGGSGETISGSASTICALIIIIWCICSCCVGKG